MLYSNEHTLNQLIANIINEEPTSSVVNGVIAILDNTRNIYEITEEELLLLKGIGHKKANSLVSALKLNQIISSRKIIGEKIYMNSPGLVADFFMEEMRHLDREHFRVLMLDTKNQIIGYEIISIGSLNSSIVHPREVYKNSVKRSAASIIAVHNHPSGIPAPSQTDIDITKRLIEAGDILGIKFLDHLIIGDGTYISFKEKLLL